MLPEASWPLPRPRVIAGLTLSILALAGGAFAVVGASALAPLIRVEMRLTETGVGAIASAAYLGAMLTARYAGRLTDRVGPVTVIVLGMLALATGISVSAVAPNTVLLYGGIVVAGLGYGAVNPATTVLANPTSARRRGLVMSVKQSGVPLGGMVAGAVLPAAGVQIGWRLAMIGPIATCLLIAALARWGGGTYTRGVTPPPPPAAGIRLRLPIGYGYGLVMAGVQVTVFALTTVFLVTARGLTATQAGLGMSLLLIGGITGRPFWGWLSDAFPTHRPMFLQASAVLAAGSLGGLGVASGPLLAIVLFAVGLGAAGWNGVYVAAIAEAASDRVGSATGSSLVLINLGAVTFPLAVGALVESTNSWALGWAVCGLVCLAAVAVIAVGMRRTDGRSVLITQPPPTLEEPW